LRLLFGRAGLGLDGLELVGDVWHFAEVVQLIGQQRLQSWTTGIRTVSNPPFGVTVTAAHLIEFIVRHAAR
jgi:hypothetical protein